MRAMLAYLALRPNQPVSRDELTTALWPETDETAGRSRLRKAIWKLRQILDSAGTTIVISVTQRTITLICSPDAVDAVEFKRLVTVSRGDQEALREAVDLYKGDLLPDITDEWVERDRYHCQALFLRATKQLVALLISKQAAETALAYARRAVELDPTDEEASYLFMQAALISGQTAAALARYDVLSRTLTNDLGVTPSSEVLALFDQIRSLSAYEQARESAASHILPTDEFAVDPVPLTARTPERLQLLNSVRRTGAGRSVAVIITGPAGVGKTRLANAVIADAHLEGLQVYKGRCSDVPNPPPYHPIVEALWPKLSCATSEQSPALAALLSTLLPQARQRKKKLTAVGSFDAALISENLLRILPLIDDPPVLLVLDDIHRADHATWSWLISLLQRLADFHVCAVLTARTGETEDQDQRVAQLVAAGAQAMPLGPLDAVGVRTLVSAALGVPRAPSVLWRMLLRYTGGNPLQILEAVRLLRGHGLLRYSGDTWTIDANASEVLAKLTFTQVSALVKERVDLLPETARDILSAAAVFGMESSPDLLRSLVRLPEHRFFLHVDRLIRHRLLIGRDNGAKLRFPHEEIRKAVLEQITPIRRRWLHARAASLVARTGTSRPEDLYWHYHGAGDILGALSAASDAGDNSYAVGEHHSAIAWYERALTALDHTHEAANLPVRLRLQLKLEAALDKHGDRPRQLFVLELAAEAARVADHQAEFCEALIRRSLCLTRMNRRSEAVEVARRAAELAHERSDLFREAHAHRATALAHETDDAKAVEFFKKALGLFRQLGTTTEESLVYSELATAYDRLGNRAAALTALDKAATLVPHDDRIRAFLVARRASALLWTGRLSETYAALQESLMLLRRQGDRIGEARTLRVLSDAHVQSGRYRDALAAAGQGLQIAKKANDARLIAGILNALLSGVYRRLGLIHRAQTAFAVIVDLMSDDPHLRLRAMFEDSLATVYLHAGLLNQAHTLGQRALVNAVAVHDEGYVSSEAHLHLAHVLVELGKADAAREHLLSSLAYHRSSGELPYLAFGTALFAQVAVDLGNHQEAQCYLRESIRVLHRIDMLQDSHMVYWLHGYVWKKLGFARQAGRAFRNAYAELSRIAASLGAPLRRRFLALPFQRRILEAVGMEPVVMLPNTTISGPGAGFLSADSSGIRSASTRRQAVLQALSDPTGRPNRRTLAAAFGVTPRTITNDIAALRRAGHQIVTPKAVH
jgi:DNA-binding SARP family transcriptional activator